MGVIEGGVRIGGGEVEGVRSREGMGQRCLWDRPKIGKYGAGGEGRMVPGLVEAFRCGFAEGAGVEEASSESGAGSFTRWRLGGRVEVARDVVVEVSFSQGRVRAIYILCYETARMVETSSRACALSLNPASPKEGD